MAKLLIILIVGLIFEAIGVVFLSRGLKEISDWLFAAVDIRNPAALSSRLTQHRDALSEFVWRNLSADDQAILGDANSSPERKAQTIAVALNHLITGGSLFERDRFGSFEVSQETRNLLAHNPEGNELVHLNRLLLHDAYPGELAEPETKPTSASAVRHLVGRGVINPHILLGVLFEALFFIALLMLMSRADVSFVWPLTSLSFVVTTIAAKIYLHEEVSTLRWSGVCLIMMGAALITWTEKQSADQAAPPAVAAPGRAQ
jgi:hypothetical protein